MNENKEEPTETIRCKHGNTYWHIVEDSLYVYDSATGELDWVWCRGAEPTYVGLDEPTKEER